MGDAEKKRDAEGKETAESKKKKKKATAETAGKSNINSVKADPPAPANDEAATAGNNVEVSDEHMGDAEKKRESEGKEAAFSKKKKASSGTAGNGNIAFEKIAPRAPASDAPAAATAGNMGEAEKKRFAENIISSNNKKVSDITSEKIAPPAPGSEAPAAATAGNNVEVSDTHMGDAEKKRIGENINDNINKKKVNTSLRRENPGSPLPPLPLVGGHTWRFQGQDQDYEKDESLGEYVIFEGSDNISPCSISVDSASVTTSNSRGSRMLKDIDEGNILNQEEGVKTRRKTDAAGNK